MQNTGTWNSNIVVLLLFLFLLPTFLTFVVCFFREIFNTSRAQGVVLPLESKQYTFEDIKMAALKKAAEGDRYARDWCTENIFNQLDDTSNSIPDTDIDIKKDVVSFLVSTGYTKKIATSLVKSLVSEKQYLDASSLFVDALNRGRKK